MRISELIQISPQARNWHKLQTLKQTLIFHQTYYSRHCPHLISQRDQRVYEETISRLDRDVFISGRQSVKAIIASIWPNCPPRKTIQHDDLEQAMVQLMNETGRQARAAAHAFNLSAEMAVRTLAGAYIVFNTLTVRSGAYYAVFNKNSVEFKQYIRRITKLVGNDHSYFAAVEEGGQHGRLHIHVLHLFNTLPKEWTDPNRGRSTPNLREITQVKHLWSHGHSTPIAVRYSPQDAFGKHGWRWPIDRETGDALRIRSPQAFATYMTKYITKGYTSNKRAKLLWRVRKSHSLGRQLLSELCNPLSNNSLLLLTTDPTIKLKLNNRTIPPQLVRLAAMRSLQNRHYMTPTNNSADLLLTHAKICTPRPSLLRSLRASTLTKSEYNPQNTTNILILPCFAEATYEQLRTDIEQSRFRIDQTYFRRSLNGYGTTTTADIITATRSNRAQAISPPNPNPSSTQDATLRPY